MKIVCLIGAHAHAVAFANRIHRQHPLSLVVVESQSTGGAVAEAWRAGGLGAVATGVARRVGKLRAASTDRARLDDWWGEDWGEPDASIPRLDTEDVNASEVGARLRDVVPDLVLVESTTILKRRLLEALPLTLNIHPGLSPYYRGNHCIDWALLNSDPHNIGVTVHRVVRRIDAGDIVVQARAGVRPEDTSESLEAQVFRLGCEKVLELIPHLERGELPVFHAQESNRGLLRLNRHWLPEMTRALDALEQQGGVARMLEKPARGSLPIVESAAFERGQSS